MKIFVSVLTALALSLSQSAGAWSLWEINGAKMDIDGKDVRVASVDLEKVM